MRKLLVAVVVLLLPACTRPEPAAPAVQGQTYAQAVAIVCDVDRLAGITAAEADPLALGQQRTEYVNAHVENPDGIYLRTMLSVKGAAEQATMLRAEAKKAGMSRCALADALAAEGTGGLSP